MKNLIELRDIKKTYKMGAGEVHALDGISLSIQKGEFAAIVGRSGSGKSTLMNIIGCLDTPTSGSYRLAGEDVSKFSEKRLARVRNREIGFIFQSFNLIGSLPALENVELPLLYRGVDRAERRCLAEDALSRVGLAGRMDHLPSQMSGGQQQRVAIARAIAAEPPIILADEPTGNLDTRSGSEIMEILRGLQKSGRTVVLITHDERIARSADRTVRLCDGKLEADSALGEALPAALQRTSEKILKSL
jgi:putative ABC transport system ATP-binding protein